MKTNFCKLLGALLFGGLFVAAPLAHAVGAPTKDVEASTSLVSTISVTEYVWGECAQYIAIGRICLRT